MRQFLEQALEDIDASIFSGDLLHCDEERDELKEYIARWQRSIGAYEGEADRVADQVATLERAIQALRAERDALAAQVERLTPLARRCIWGALVWNDHNFGDLRGCLKEETHKAGILDIDEANGFLAATPQQHLAKIRAEVVEVFAGALSNTVQIPNGPITRVDYYKAAIRHAIQFAEQYAAKLRKGGE